MGPSHLLMYLIAVVQAVINAHSHSEKDRFFSNIYLEEPVLGAMLDLGASVTSDKL